LRQYAQERLLSRDKAAVDLLRTLHARHYAAMAEESALGMHGPDQAKWLERLELEHDNLRAGLEWGKAADASSDRVELALRLAAPLYLPWLRQGHGREGRQHFETLLAHPNGQRPTRARAQVLFAVGSFALWQDGEEAQAWTLLNQSLSLGKDLGATQVMAEARHNLGVVLTNRGDKVGARTQHEEALRLTRASGDISGIRWSLEDLADCADEDGDIARASELREEALTLARQSGDYHGIASILQTQGNLARAAGKVDRARELIGEGLSLMQQIGCQHCSAYYLGDLAFVAAAAADSERSVRLLGASEALRERTGIVTPTSKAKAIEKTLVQARHLLGETAYEAAWSEGLAMSLRQATTYALLPLPPLPSGAPNIL
jgi:tetratricopeptide (TPR) repeat protein